MNTFWNLKKTVLLALILFNSFTYLSGQSADRIVNITDYGYETGSRKNVIPAIQKAIENNSSHPFTLIFPKGRYDFWTDFSSDSIKTIGFDLNDLKSVTIDGEGSQFIFHGNMQIMSINKCENITIKNFSVDWEHPFIYQGEYVNTTENYIDIEFDKMQYPFTIENQMFYMTGEGWKAVPTGFFNLYDRDTKEMLYKTHDGSNEHMFSLEAEEIIPGVVRFHGTPNVKPPKGTYTTLMAGMYMTDGIFINNSKDIYLEDLTIYHALSNGFLGSRSENITMKNASVTINSEKGRVFSTIADASHFLNCKGLIKVINCAHTGAMDDFINVHGSYTKIDSILDDKSLITVKERWTGEPQEEIWFVDSIHSQRSEVRKIESIEKISDNSSKVTFTEPLPKNIEAGDFLESKTWTASLEIRDSRILKNNRARGILVTTPRKVTIENNYFRSAGAAILIEGDTDYWYESGATRDVIIRNNVFDNCLTSGCITGSRWEWGEAIISITPSHRPQDFKTEPYHQNIKIENNVFKTFDVPLLHARSVRGLLFKNNEVVQTYDFEPYLWQKSSFLLDGCRDVEIIDNKIDDKYMTKTVHAQHMRKSDIKVEGFKVTLE